MTGSSDCRIMVWDLKEVHQLYGTPPEDEESTDEVTHTPTNATSDWYTNDHCPSLCVVLCLTHLVIRMMTARPAVYVSIENEGPGTDLDTTLSPA